MTGRNNNMPFINVKLWKGRTNEQKRALIRELTKSTCETIDCTSDQVQISIEEFEKTNWGLNGKSADEE
ncbi:4-oxalocrotonate tautomerase family protein [Elusimicrobiota bacterium]